MTSSVTNLRSFLERASAVALVEVTEALGSTPREQGAWMLVSPDRIFGTIGGGQLEFLAIERVREAFGDIRTEGAITSLDIPLGPQIGQCCGGRVGLSIRHVDEQLARTLVAKAQDEQAKLPQVLVFGGGHVGQALAAALSLLPLKVIVVDTRAEALEEMPAEVDTRLTPVPEEMVRKASPGTAFVILTHDHALDFLIVAEALKRTDAAYVGMIGSRTKKATFKNWYLKEAGGSEEAYSHLISPIGGTAVKDKRPAVIAALAAAEIMTALVPSGNHSSLRLAAPPASP